MDLVVGGISQIGLNLPSKFDRLLAIERNWKKYQEDVPAHRRSDFNNCVIQIEDQTISFGILPGFEMFIKMFPIQECYLVFFI
jgi:hypothetical protein